MYVGLRPRKGVQGSRRSLPPDPLLCLLKQLWAGNWYTNGGGGSKQISSAEWKRPSHRVDNNRWAKFVQTPLWWRLHRNFLREKSRKFKHTSAWQYTITKKGKRVKQKSTRLQCQVRASNPKAQTHAQTHTNCGAADTW